MKKILAGGRGGGGEWGGGANYGILLATMVGRQREFFISNRLKGLYRCLLRNYLESVVKVLTFVRFLKVQSLGLNC